MAKNKNLPQHSKITHPIASPVTGAVSATMPILYTEVTAAQTQTHTHSGPLPAPEILKKYDEVSPGLVLRIIQMAEGEAEHRRKMEAEVIAIQSRDQKSYRLSELLGQIFGLTIGLAALAVALVAAIYDRQWAASFIGVGGVTALVSAFILGRSYLLKIREQEIKQQIQAAKPRSLEQKATQETSASAAQTQKRHKQTRNFPPALANALSPCNLISSRMGSSCAGALRADGFRAATWR